MCFSKIWLHQNILNTQTYLLVGIDFLFRLIYGCPKGITGFLAILSRFAYVKGTETYEAYLTKGHAFLFRLVTSLRTYTFFHQVICFFAMVLKDGYLDDIFDVLDAHCHPCIMLGRLALLWMGVAVFQESVSVPTVEYHVRALRLN